MNKIKIYTLFLIFFISGCSTLKTEYIIEKEKFVIVEDYQYCNDIKKLDRDDLTYFFNDYFTYILKEYLECSNRAKSAIDFINRNK